MNLNKIASVLVIFIASIVILIYGQSLLMPFIFALLLWFLVRKTKSILDKMEFIKKKFPSWVKSLITSVFIFAILGFVSNALSSSISSLASSYKTYQSNVEVITLGINQMFNINLIESNYSAHL